MAVRAKAYRSMGLVVHTADKSYKEYVVVCGDCVNDARRKFSGLYDFDEAMVVHPMMGEKVLCELCRRKRKLTSGRKQRPQADNTHLFTHRVDYSYKRKA